MERLVRVTRGCLSVLATQLSGKTKKNVQKRKRRRGKKVVSALLICQWIKWWRRERRQHQQRWWQMRVREREWRAGKGVFLFRVLA